MLLLILPIQWWLLTYSETWNQFDCLTFQRQWQQQIAMFYWLKFRTFSLQSTSVSVNSFRVNRNAYVYTIFMTKTLKNDILSTVKWLLNWVIVIGNLYNRRYGLVWLLLDELVKWWNDNSWCVIWSQSIWPMIRCHPIILITLSWRCEQVHNVIQRWFTYISSL